LLTSSPAQLAAPAEVLTVRVDPEVVKITDEPRPNSSASDMVTKTCSEASVTRVRRVHLVRGGTRRVQLVREGGGDLLGGVRDQVPAGVVDLDARGEGRAGLGRRRLRGHDDAGGRAHGDCHVHEQRREAGR